MLCLMLSNTNKAQIESLVGSIGNLVHKKIPDKRRIDHFFMFESEMRHAVRNMWNTCELAADGHKKN